MKTISWYNLNNVFTNFELSFKNYDNQVWYRNNGY